MRELCLLYTDMKKLLLLLLLSILCINLQAENTYKFEKQGNKYVCQGEIDGKEDDKATFGACVLWALEQTKETDKKSALKKFDLSAMHLTFNPSISLSEVADRKYSFQLILSVNKGKLSFLVQKVKCSPNNVLGMFSSTAIDKIDLQKKPENKVMIDEFTVLCDKYVTEMLRSILSREINLTYWEAAVRGQIVKGMDADEVKMAIGTPEEITENSQRTVWTYADGQMVVFEDGVVTGSLKN